MCWTDCCDFIETGLLIKYIGGWRSALHSTGQLAESIVILLFSISSLLNWINCKICSIALKQFQFTITMQHFFGLDWFAFMKMYDLLMMCISDMQHMDDERVWFDSVKEAIWPKLVLKKALKEWENSVTFISIINNIVVVVVRNVFYRPINIHPWRDTRVLYKHNIMI